MATHTNLGAAICAIMSEVKGVEKTGMNTAQRYSYASDADLLLALQPKCAEHGIFIFPSKQEVITEEVGATKSGSRRWLTTIKAQYTVSHVESGQSIIISSVGSGIDSEDKGAYKAQTGALKYALRQLFMIPTGDDAEKWEGKTEEPEQRQQPRHHPSWESDRKRFCAALGELGTNYDDVVKMCAMMKRNRPSHMDVEARGKLIAYLKSDAGKKSLESANLEQK